MRKVSNWVQITSLAGLSFLGVGSTCDPYAQRPLKFKTPSATIGSLAETEFRAFLDACSVLNVMDLGDHTAIPDVIRKEPAIADHFLLPAIAFAGSAGSKVFRFSSLSKDIRGYPSAITSVETPFISSDIIGSALPVLKPKVESTHVGFVHDCQTYMGGDLTGTVTPPNAAISAALKTEQHSDVRLVMVYGVFESPLNFLISQGGASQLLAYSAILDLYARNPAYRGKDVYYVGGFRGALIFRSQASRNATKFDFRSSASASVPLGSGEFHAAAGFDLSSSFDVSAYTTIILPDSDDKNVMALPAPATIDAFTKSANPITDQLNTKVSNGIDIQFWDQYVGVPAGICRGNWTFTKKSGSLDLLRASVTGEPTLHDGIPACKLNSSGTVAFSGNPANANVAYEYATIVGESSPLVFVGHRKFNTSQGPMPVIPNGFIYPQLDFGPQPEINLKWKVDVTWVGNVNWDRMATDGICTNLKPSDAGDSKKNLASDATLRCDPSHHTCSLLVSPATVETIRQSDLAQGISYDKIPATCNLVVPVGTNGTVPTELQFTLEWPRRAARFFQMK